jgi:hypothetical protein
MSAATLVGPWVTDSAYGDRVADHLMEIVGRTLARIILVLLAGATAFIGLLAAGAYDATDENETRGTLMVIGAGITTALVLLSLLRKYTEVLWIAALVITATLVGTLPDW